MAEHTGMSICRQCRLTVRGLAPAEDPAGGTGVAGPPLGELSGEDWVMESPRLGESRELSSASKAGAASGDNSVGGLNRGADMLCSRSASARGTVPIAVAIVVALLMAS